nr:hypothetical protein [Candidatus Sigynarchaeota archaeon]
MEDREETFINDDRDRGDMQLIAPNLYIGGPRACEENPDRFKVVHLGACKNVRESDLLLKPYITQLCNIFYFIDNNRGRDPVLLHDSHAGMSSASAVAALYLAWTGEIASEREFMDRFPQYMPMIDDQRLVSLNIHGLVTLHDLPRGLFVYPCCGNDTREPYSFLCHLDISSFYFIDTRANWRRPRHRENVFIIKRDAVRFMESLPNHSISLFFTRNDSGTGGEGGGISWWMEPYSDLLRKKLKTRGIVLCDKGPSSPVFNEIPSFLKKLANTPVLGARHNFDLEAWRVMLDG